MPYETSYAERIQYKQLQDAAYQAGLDAVTNLEAALALAGLALPPWPTTGPWAPADSSGSADAASPSPTSSPR